MEYLLRFLDEAATYDMLNYVVNMMITIIILLILSAVCDSIVDTVDHHQSTSIFSKMKNQKWWNANQGWKNKYVDYDADIIAGVTPRRVKWSLFGIKFNKPVQLTDSWHFFKSLKITYNITAACVGPFSFLSLLIKGSANILHIITCIIVGVLIIGTARNYVFSLFYEKVLILKDKNKQ